LAGNLERLGEGQLGLLTHQFHMWAGEGREDRQQ